MEEDFFYGFVDDVTETEVTVSGDDGNTVTFNYSGAELKGAEEIGAGDEAEIIFLGRLSEDGTYTFRTLIAQKVTKDGINEKGLFDGIEVGDTVTVIY